MPNRKVIVSFDFDSTLATRKMQMLLSVFDRSKVEVFIVTSRCPTSDINKNEDLVKVAKAFGIEDDHIICTDGGWKSKTLEQIGADIHFDDMPDEIAMINNECTMTLGALVSKDIWGDLKYLETCEPVGSIQTDLDEFD